MTVTINPSSDGLVVRGIHANASVTDGVGELGASLHGHVVNARGALLRLIVIDAGRTLGDNVLYE